MADIAWCHTCRGEFVASVGTCPDCGVALDDEEPVTVDQRTADPVVPFNIHGMPLEERRLLETLLAQREIPHVTDRATDELRVGSRHASTTENLLGEVAAIVETAGDDAVAVPASTARSRLKQLLTFTDRWGRPDS